ncbi:hypothetical protein K503DRAFT_802961 [Rhizopogon vinicolor AM-OR11-026]|uniref:DUF6533 domain-containing protein n=1 Tax=Rhizopogon vinicolor AM-OR11-026 TaxID=1314800 RepID=A0A1B7MRL0_9AGAM|nr:hypothetical protein K503DRAFT_802961 [Rhizopogon vinicolor AM-OR11-026]
MALVSNDPSLWLIINYLRGYSYFQVGCLIVVVYDWALTLGQEFELVWRQRWSLMTFLYLSVRYIGIPFTVVLMLINLPSVLFTDVVSILCATVAVLIRLTALRCRGTILYLVAQYISIITNIMLSVIIIVRLYAMYQRSRQMLIFLVVTFLAIKITSGVIATIGTTMHISGKEHVLSGAHICLYAAQGDGIFLLEMNWILGTAWEIIVLCLAVWIAVKHFYELQRPSTGWTVGDCFTILVKTHVFYFASFITVSTLELTDYFSPKLEDSTSVAYGVFAGILNVTQVVQMYILGPRLILGVREYHANLVANSDEGLGMISIVFKERVHISTSSDV